MAKEQNLVPFTTDQSRDEAVKNGAKGGVASGSTRRRRKLLREAIEIALEYEYPVEGGDMLDGVAAMALTAVKAAIAGDWKAWELVRDTTGQKPVERVVRADVSAEVIDEIEALVFGNGAENASDTPGKTAFPPLTK